MSGDNYYHELPNKGIIPQEYYDKYPVIFRHYHMDKKLVRIGMNGKQRQKYKKDQTQRFTGELGEISTKKQIQVARKLTEYRGASDIGRGDSTTCEAYEERIPHLLGLSGEGYSVQ